MAAQKPAFILVLCCLIVLALSACASTREATSELELNQAYNQDKARADQAFEAGDYAIALDIYRLHARLGSPFAQHRLAVMYAHGLGVDVNLVDAFMWADLAAADGSQHLADYRDSLGKQLSANQRNEARSKALVLYGSQDTYALIEETYLKEELEDGDAKKESSRGCTGSRLGTNCSR